ncbi:unnamed protein product [Lota lota]
MAAAFCESQSCHKKLLHVLRKMEVQSGVQQLELLPPASVSPPSGANQRSECEEGHRDTGASADSHSEDTPASQRDEKKVRLAACRTLYPMGLQFPIQDARESHHWLCGQLRSTVDDLSCLRVLTGKIDIHPEGQL